MIHVLTRIIYPSSFLSLIHRLLHHYCCLDFFSTNCVYRLEKMIYFCLFILPPSFIYFLILSIIAAILLFLLLIVSTTLTKGYTLEEDSLLFFFLYFFSVITVVIFLPTIYITPHKMIHFLSTRTFFSFLSLFNLPRHHNYFLDYFTSR